MKIREYNGWLIEARREGLRGFVAFAYPKQFDEIVEIEDRDGKKLSWHRVSREGSVSGFPIEVRGRGPHGRFTTGLDAVESARRMIDSLPEPVTVEIPQH